MKRFLLKYKHQDWAVEAVLFSDGNVAANEHGGVFEYESFDEMMRHFPSSEFDLVWIDLPQNTETRVSTKSESSDVPI